MSNSKYGETIARIDERTGLILARVGELDESLKEMNGRVRQNSEDVSVALDRTKRIGTELDTHCLSNDAHGGGTAKVGASAQVKVALVGLGAGLGGGIIALIGSLLTK